MSELSSDGLTNFLRMDSNTFNLLLSKVASLITERDTHLRKAIPPEQRLAVTLRYLATGKKMKSVKVS